MRGDKAVVWITTWQRKTRLDQVDEIFTPFLRRPSANRGAADVPPCTMYGRNGMPMYTDRSRRRGGPTVAEVVAGVLGVVTLILLLGA
ncbi:hypothetical protein N8152_02000 [bacterium]|nr:hypothetical protein [bacterium]